MAEDVPQVSEYIRTLLAVESRVSLARILSDGTRVVEAASRVRPDAIMVDWLLQGKLKGPGLVEKLRKSGLGIPVVVLTVPQRAVSPAPERGVDAVLTLPLSGYELVETLGRVMAAREAQTPRGCRVVSVFSPKGGVGKTTIAFNLAVAMAQLGVPTALVDGSLQYGDLRTLLKVPANAPSMLDLPAERPMESDLRDVMWPGPAGADILLAPPRIEMAEMISVRDVEKVMTLLRHAYGAVVIDTAPSLSELTLAFLDASDVVLSVVTYDSTTLHNTVSAAEVFARIGYPPDKLRYLVNRADWSGGLGRDDLARALGRAPDFEVVSDGRLVVQANNDGMPFVISSPISPISLDVGRAAAALVGPGSLMAAGS